MTAVISTILLLLDLARWILIAMIIMSWLISFNVINTSNQFVATVWQALNAITEPMLGPIRKLIHRFFPNTGGLDLSPILLFVALYFLEILIRRDIAPALLS
ncbi:MAG: YggT family protein [Devosiaceae bacterium]|nr:YggT family protein [Devosiaceae bacterium]